MTDLEFARRITLRRPRVSFENEGEAKTVYDLDTILAVVEMPTPGQVQTLPEGTRFDDLISVWSASELRAADGKRIESDVLIVDGNHYKVTQVEDRSANGYFKAIATGFMP